MKKLGAVGLTIVFLGGACGGVGSSSEPATSKEGSAQSLSAGSTLGKSNGALTPEELAFLQKFEGQACLASEGCPKSLVCSLPAGVCSPDATGVCVIPAYLKGYRCAPPMGDGENVVCVCKEGIAGNAHDACHASMFGQTILHKGPCEEATPKCEDPADYRQCNVDADCVCGVNRVSNECDFGSAECIDTETQCPDFCTGINGHLKMVCKSNVCMQVAL